MEALRKTQKTSDRTVGIRVDIDAGTCGVRTRRAVHYPFGRLSCEDTIIIDTWLMEGHEIQSVQQSERKEPHFVASCTVYHQLISAT